MSKINRALDFINEFQHSPTPWFYNSFVCELRDADSELVAEADIALMELEK